MAEFVMPRLGADMEAGTLVEWRRRPGDPVKRGDVIAEVETDKGVIDVEVFAEGTVERLLVEPGQKVPVGTVLATIRDGAGPTPASPLSTPRVAPAGPAPPEPARTAGSPAARRLARERGVDLAAVRGTGPAGVVTREDVRRAASPGAEPAPSAATPRGEASAASGASGDVRARRMRQAIAAAMARSKREIPHYYLSTTIDLHRATAWLTEENLKRPVAERLLPGVLLLKATALALREVPELNALWEGDAAVPKESVHLGVAISLRRGGLIAPALRDADRRTLDELMRGLRDLTARARSGGLRSSELSDPTVTVTSLGDRGVEAVFGVIYPPQVALVGFGKVVERPWAEAGGLFVRPVVTATLSADHRVSDGHRGGLFLAAVDRLLQEPQKL